MNVTFISFSIHHQILWPYLTTTTNRIRSKNVSSLSSVIIVFTRLHQKFGFKLMEWKNNGSVRISDIC